MSRKKHHSSESSGKRHGASRRAREDIELPKLSVAEVINQAARDGLPTPSDRLEPGSPKSPMEALRLQKLAALPEKEVFVKAERKVADPLLVKAYKIRKRKAKGSGAGVSRREPQ